MKTVWIASFAIMASASALAQSTIYKHVDDGGRVTYSNKPMKGATVMELDPLTVVPSPAPAVMAKALATDKDARAEARPAVAIVTPVGNTKPSLASIEPQLQKRRDEDRRRILEQELKQEEDSLESSRASLAQEQQNPTLVAAVRVAQQTAEPTVAQMQEIRANIDKTSGRIRGLQSTVAEHEKNVEALKKELGALKP
jgi:hypothetical protein